MALLPPKYLKSVVALGEMTGIGRLLVTGEPMSETATGFLYAYPISDKQVHNGYRLWLVTCKHAIQPDMMVRLNKSGNQGKQTFNIRQSEGNEWTLHPGADVAVIPAVWEDFEKKGLQWETFAARGKVLRGAGVVEVGNALKRADAVEISLSEGGEVFVLGFPIGWRAGKQDYPIVRHGMLAQIQGWIDSDHDTFLVDGSGFPGNSGGPVITKPEMGAAEGTQAVPGAWLIGMVMKRSFSPIGEGKETADLIEVVPMDLIDETVEMAMAMKGESSHHSF